MTRVVDQLEAKREQVAKWWAKGKFVEMMGILKKVPQDYLLEVLVCAADDVPVEHRLGLLDRLDLVDTEVATMLGVSFEDSFAFYQQRALEKMAEAVLG